MDMIDNTYKVRISRFCLYFSLIILASLAISIMPLMLNTDQSVFFTSQPLYLAILLLFVMVLFLGWWGLSVGGLMFLICGLVGDMPAGICFTNGFANILQLALFVLCYKWLKTMKDSADKKGKQIRTNCYDNGSVYFNLYNFFLLIAGILYVFCSFVLSNNSGVIMCGFFGTIMLATIIKSLPQKKKGIKADLRLIVFTVFMAFLPSLISSSLSFYLGSLLSHTTATAIDYISTWTMSNYILIQTFGYSCYQIFYKKSFDISSKIKASYEEEHLFDISSVIYYIAVFVWNLLILFLILRDSQNMKYMFFFPWALGNAFLMMNLYFCEKEKYDMEEYKEGKEGSAFKWFEERIVVVEKNTSSIIMIIALLLPLSLKYLNDSTSFLKTLFILNIFCVSIAVGLIWTPKSYVKFISLLKTLKTVFYTYSISSLLLCVVVLMRCL